MMLRDPRLSAQEAARLIRAARSANIDELAEIDRELGDRRGLGTAILRDAIEARFKELCQ